ncbi:MAG: 50S ribosomal protein L9 [Nitrospinae bacterium RIFCSPLOWO2_12_FULL_47_7]|nr:MAG: 50S ribosomal protein L9 [Nitrospinae bacterium RIFCSPLOWO2_12_FULL_47_7]
MKLLLKEDVDNLGSVGDEVQVRDGYGRNFLIPRGKAILANEKNLKQFNHQKSIVQGKLKKLRKSSEAAAAEINKVTCIITKKVGDQGKLFGAVTSQEIADALKKAGVEIDKRKIVPHDPIKSLGDFKVSLKLAGQVLAQINVSVVAEKEEAKVEAEVKEETKTTASA